MPAPNQHNMTTLEQIVDACGIIDVVDALATICNEKAEHIRSAWQDDKTAKVWDKAGKHLDVTSVKLSGIMDRI